MKYRRLGKSGLKLSEIALGSWLTGNQETYVELVQGAFTMAINHFDSANIYGNRPHKSEELLGRKYKFCSHLAKPFASGFGNAYPI